MPAEQIPLNPLISNLIVIIAINLLFAMGIWVRSVFERDAEPLTKRQIVASTIAAFFLLGAPLGKVTHDAILGAQDLFVYISASVPPFATGITAREQIKKMFRGSLGQNP